MIETLVPDPNKADGRSGLAPANAPTTGVISYYFAETPPSVIGDLELNDDPSVTRFMLSGATTITDLFLQTSPLLSVVACPDLTNVINQLVIRVLAISAISFPSLVSAGTDPVNSLFQIGDNLSLTEIDLPLLANGVVFDFPRNAVSTMSFPSLTTILSSLAIASSPNLTSISLPVLNDPVNNPNLVFQENPALTSILLPALSTINVIQVIDNPLLTTFSLPSLVSTSGTMTLTGNAFSAATVNAMLAKLVAIGYTGLLDMSGGTNAAPTGQGIADKATLIGQGASVTTN